MFLIDLASHTSRCGKRLVTLVVVNLSQHFRTCYYISNLHTFSSGWFTNKVVVVTMDTKLSYNIDQCTNCWWRLIALVIGLNRRNPWNLQLLNEMDWWILLKKMEMIFVKCQSIHCITLCKTACNVFYEIWQLVRPVILFCIIVSWIFSSCWVPIANFHNWGVSSLKKSCRSVRKSDPLKTKWSMGSRNCGEGWFRFSSFAHVSVSDSDDWKLQSLVGNYSSSFNAVRWLDSIWMMTTRDNRNRYLGRK